MFFNFVFSFPSYPGQWRDWPLFKSPCTNLGILFAPNDGHLSLRICLSIWVWAGICFSRLVFPGLPSYEMESWKIGEGADFLKITVIFFFPFLYTLQISSYRTVFIHSPLLITNYHKINTRVNPTRVTNQNSISTTETHLIPPPAIMPKNNINLFCLCLNFWNHITRICFSVALSLNIVRFLHGFCGNHLFIFIVAYEMIPLYDYGTIYVSIALPRGH